MYIFKKKKIYEQIDKYVRWKAVRYPMEAHNDYIELITFASVTGIEDIFDVSESYILRWKMFVQKKESVLERMNHLTTIRCFVRFYKNIVPKELAKALPLLEFKEKV